MSATAAPPGPTIQEQAPVLLAQVAGYVGHRTVAVSPHALLARPRPPAGPSAIGPVRATLTERIRYPLHPA
jgi:hypothetical protein